MKRVPRSWTLSSILTLTVGLSTARADGPPAVVLPATVVSKVQCAVGSYENPVILRDATEVEKVVPLSIRWPASQYRIRVLVVDDDVSEVTFTEIPRKNRLASDLAAVVAEGEPEAPAAGTTSCSIWAATAQQERGFVTVTATNKHMKTVASATVVTGPREHWFITAGLPVTHVTTLKYNSATGTLEPQSAQPQFYIGFGYQFGDLVVVQPEDANGRRISISGLQTSPPWYSWQRLSLQALILASSKPTDSVGVALGYTEPPWPAHGFGAISVFAGRFWSKEDEIVDGKLIPDNRYAASWRVGVSFNVNAVFGWFMR